MNQQDRVAGTPVVVIGVEGTGLNAQGNFRAGIGHIRLRWGENGWGDAVCASPFMIHPAAGIRKKMGVVGLGGWGAAQHPECKGSPQAGQSTTQ